MKGWLKIRAGLAEKTKNAKAGYSKKFYREHEADILLHKAAKKRFDELGIKKPPTVKSLSAEYAELLAEKKKAYGEYREARDEMKERNSPTTTPPVRNRRRPITVSL